MTKENIASAIFNFTGGKDANDLPEGNRRKLKDFWNDLEYKRGFEFMVDVLKLYSKKVNY